MIFENGICICVVRHAIAHSYHGTMGARLAPNINLIIASPSYPSSIVRATYVAAGRTGYQTWLAEALDNTDNSIFHNLFLSLPNVRKWRSRSDCGWSEWLVCLDEPCLRLAIRICFRESFTFFRLHSAMPAELSYGYNPPLT